MHSFWLEGVSTPVLHKMLDELRDSGSSVNSIIGRAIPAYAVNGSGIVAEVSYDPIHMRALVEIRSEPMLVPFSYIESEVRRHLAVASGAV